jgi:hypothetical protein
MATQYTNLPKFTQIGIFAFSLKEFNIKFYKNGLAYILGNFFTISSCHPGHQAATSILHIIHVYIYAYYANVCTEKARNNEK